MRYPNLLLEIRKQRLAQYEVAYRAGLRESRLSHIVRHGDAKPAERVALCRALNIAEAVLFEEAKEFSRARNSSQTDIT